MLSIACCLLLMIGLPLETWLRFIVWLILGLGVYFLYSKSRSDLADRPAPSAS
jgi:APA family basic amino acid/polyamine antiporter